MTWAMVTMTDDAKRWTPGDNLQKKQMTKRAPTITTLAAKHLLNAACAQHDHEQAHALAAAWRPKLIEERLELAEYYDLLEALAVTLDDPCYGLKIIQTPDLEVFDALGYLLYTSETFGQGLEALCEYRALWSDGESFWLEQDQDAGLVWLGWRAYGAYRPAHRYHAQMFLADMLMGCAVLLGEHVPVVAVELEHGHDGDEALAIAPLLGAASLRYDAQATRIGLTPQVLEHPMPRADAMLSAYFKAQVSARLSAHELSGAAQDHDEAQAPLIEEVSQLIVELLPRRQATLSTISPRLAMSERTLQRRLSEHGLTFGALVDQVRHILALSYLREGHAIGQLSYMLGFSEPRAFHRAFKRWESCSPGAWLERVRLTAD